MTVSADQFDHTNRKQNRISRDLLTALGHGLSQILRKAARRIDLSIRRRQLKQTLSELAHLPPHLHRDIGISASRINFSDQ